MSDAIDELIERSKDHRELRAFHELHKAHPEILDFLVSEIRLRIESGFSAFSYRSLWEYTRWKITMEKGPGATFLMNDHALPFYARAIAILYSGLNGRAELRKSKADDIFGLEFEPLPDERPKDYARRLRWADGTPLEKGWRPTKPHVATHPASRRPDIHKRPLRPEPNLFAAARLILTERHNLTNSAPRAALMRLEALAVELKDMGGRL
ncbi:MAG TPA: hypothetical protein VK814_18825 [Acidobacteriaceae bacterium]|jgi:hypothetical protein|nr:hypothetical protein [Acidobacteriaceae bacterium]